LIPIRSLPDSALGRQKWGFARGSEATATPQTSVAARPGDPKNPVNWLRIAEKWDALAKTLESAPSIFNRTALNRIELVQSAPLAFSDRYDSTANQVLFAQQF